MVKRLGNQPTVQKKSSIEGLEKKGTAGAPAEVKKVSPEIALQNAAQSVIKGEGLETKLGSDGKLSAQSEQRTTSSANKMSPLGSRFVADGGALSRDQIFSIIGGVKDAGDIRNAQGQYGEIAKSYARVTTEEFFDSPAAKNLTPKQQTVARKAFANLTARVSAHFSPEGLKVPDDAKLKDAALSQAAGYVAGELSRQFPGLEQDFARAAIIEHYKTGGDVEKLADKLSKAGGPGIEFFENNGWMTGNGKGDDGNWKFWGFVDLDVALNVPGVYGGEATLQFAEALAPGKGKELLGDSLNKNFWERTPDEAAVVEFCMRSSQAGWMVSKLGRGIVEANNPKKEGKALGNWTHHDMMSFDSLKTDKGWSEMVKDIDQTRSFAVHSGVITAKEANARPLEEAMLNVMSHGVFQKADDGTLSLSPHGETLRKYLKTEAYKAVAMDDFESRNSTHADAFAMQSATQAAHAVELDGAVFPSFLQHFVAGALNAGKEMDEGGGGAGVTSNHAMIAFQNFNEAAVPLVGKTKPADIFNMVTADLGFDPLPMTGAQLKGNCQELHKLGVISGYGEERVAPMSADDAALNAKDTHAMDVGLRLANNSWGAGQVHRHYADVKSKGSSDRLERSAYDLFDAHKMGTYDSGVEAVGAKGIKGDRAHELALSLVTFEVYKDLFELSDAVERLNLGEKSGA